ncbi:hypothetical protein C1H46_032261 [Malus baccata]|uniref:Condensin II complex subunit H2 N-terminal domain-containing protein n=1 Tax=Malus baccata TaxID=106549 RepID=A0A540L6R7_MALBA|nr:hypothetical protein C1H46_032261 [Malus baccata]
MTYARDESGGSNINDGGGGFHKVHAECDLKSNWELNLSQKLEEYPGGSNDSSGGGFHRVQPERDLESNWEVDLAQKLEEFLLKICFVEMPTEAEGHVAVISAEGVPFASNYYFLLI